jgi:diadenosine tetraphosphate (Ap4A) HIT family hydrolase
LHEARFHLIKGRTKRIDLDNLIVAGAVKINYEMHGNTAPHLHMHLFPRYLDDPFAGVPTDYHRFEPPVYRDDEFAVFVQTMQEKLGAAE